MRLVMKLNVEDPLGIVADLVFGTLIDRFIEEEKLLEIRQQIVEETVVDGLQFLTACSAPTGGRHIVPMRLRNTPLWLYFKSVKSSEKSVKL
jgi:hypothetical protein